MSRLPDVMPGQLRRLNESLRVIIAFDQPTRHVSSVRVLTGHERVTDINNWQRHVSVLEIKSPDESLMIVNCNAELVHDS